MPSPKRRFGLVTRIKRGLPDQSRPGGSGKAQVYFEGALTILRRDFDADDLRLLYAGRLMLSEMDRVRRLAHTSFITLPSFAADLEKYRKDLRAMALLNGLVAPVVRKPSLKAVASVALAVATVSPTPPPRRPTPPTPETRHHGGGGRGAGHVEALSQVPGGEEAEEAFPAEGGEAGQGSAADAPRRGDAAQGS